MGMTETSLTAVAPLLLRNLGTSVFIYAYNSLLTFTKKYKLLEYVRHVLLTSFLFFLRLLPSLFPSLDPGEHHHGNNTSCPSTNNNLYYHQFKPSKDENSFPACAARDSGISRALSQLLSIVNEVPVSSRKYEIVRSLAETIIEENHREGIVALREVNRTVLSAAFARTLSQLEASMVERGRGQIEDGGSETGPVKYRLNRVFKAVRSVREVSWALGGRAKEGVNRRGGGTSSEKLAAELLWLAQKLAACECGEEAVWMWASASNLGCLSLSAEPRLQGSLVKVSEFLFKQAKDLGLEEAEEEKKELQRQTRLKMLMCWLPLLCRGSIGTDAPVLSMSERVALERVLEEIIDMLEEEEEQEQVLALWLYHFTSCSSSDWPNLHASYVRWYNASRKLFSSEYKSQ